jgi:hypothetical protein
MASHNSYPHAAEEITGGWIDYGRARLLAATLENHVLDLKPRELRQLSEQDIEFIEKSVYATSDIVMKAVGKHGMRLPGFHTPHDHSIISKVVVSAGKMAELVPAPTPVHFDISMNRLKSQGGEWVRLGAIVTHNAEHLKLSSTPYLRPSMEDYTQGMAAVMERFAMANNGLQIDEETALGLRDLALLIR